MNQAHNIQIILMNVEKLMKVSDQKLHLIVEQNFCCYNTYDTDEIKCSELILSLQDPMCRSVDQRMKIRDYYWLALGSSYGLKP